MLRSLVCYDIDDENEPTEEVDDVITCHGNENPDEGKCDASLPQSVFISKDKAKKFIETAQVRLNEVKCKQKRMRKGEAFIGRKKGSKVVMCRKRKIDIDEGTKNNRDNKIGKLNKCSKHAGNDVDSNLKKEKMPIRELVVKTRKRIDLGNVNKVVLEHLMEQDFTVHDDHDPHGSRNTKIGKDLDEAIKQKDYELAQKISNEMSERQISQKIADNFKAQAYLDKKEAERKAKQKRKKKLPWMFDQKERWEVKGNM